jgi:hypothetical protein
VFNNRQDGPLNFMQQHGPVNYYPSTFSTQVSTHGYPYLSTSGHTTADEIPACTLFCTVSCMNELPNPGLGQKWVSYSEGRVWSLPILLRASKRGCNADVHCGDYMLFCFYLDTILHAEWATVVCQRPAQPYPVDSSPVGPAQRLRSVIDKQDDFSQAGARYRYYDPARQVTHSASAH